MTIDLAQFCKAMDGLWEVESHTKRPDGQTVVKYRSLDEPLVTWSHRPYHPETVPAVGTRGRIGFVAGPQS
jgi:hypothetical protein